MFKNEGRAEWNAAYDRGGNITFYPHEEIIRFVNKYVRKREGIQEFRNVMDLPEDEWDQFKSLDLGCGIGRHVKFLDEFGLEPYGIDLSETAISIGKDWFLQIGKEELSKRLMIGSVTDLPFEDESFHICVSSGVLDSMPRETAMQGLQEALRVLKPNGLMSLSLIMDPQDGDRDEIVDFGYEKDTIQSYYNVESIKNFLGGGMRVDLIEFKIITWSDEYGEEKNKRAFLIIKKK